jgi:hypothetical protein
VDGRDGSKNALINELCSLDDNTKPLLHN